MASTVIELECVPGTTTAYMEAAGGSGSAAASYATTQIAGYLHKITVTEALTGRWMLKAGDTNGSFGYRLINALTDTAETFSVVTTETLQGTDDGSIADAVWDEILTDHQTPGTFGARWQEGVTYQNTADNLIRINRNDSYDGTAHAKLSWTVTKDFTGWTPTMTIRHRATGASMMSVTPVVVDATTIEATLTCDDTAFTGLTSTEFGPHPYDIQFVSGSSCQTPIKGAAIISEDQTTG